MKLTDFQINELRILIQDCGLSSVLSSISERMRVSTVHASVTNTGETTPIRPEYEETIRNTLLDMAAMIDN